jgi:serine/threonine protein kinase
MILMSIKHPHIIKTYYITEDDIKYRIYMDLFSGDLDSFHQSKGQLDERNIYIIFHQLVSAVNYLHNVKHIVHGDIKTNNILFNNDEDLNIVLADFGLAYLWKEEDILISSVKGTPTYLAPEIRSGLPYKGYPVDVYSLGVVLFNISFPPNIYPRFDRDVSLPTYLNQLDMFRYDRLIEMKNPFLVDLIKAMIFPDPRGRITIDKVINSPWMVKMKDMV